MRRLPACCLFAVLLILGRPPGADAAAPRGGIDFNRDIRPILSENCFTCHGPDRNNRKAGLRLDLREEAFKALASGERPVVPGKPEQSLLLARIVTADPEDRMPPPKSGKQLSEAQVKLLRRWIQEGAPWKEHWSYLPVQRPEAPPVRNRRWVRNEIDAFILARLEQEKLKPSPEADRAALLRRVTLDLTGLPPTVGETDAFLKDGRSDAYERVVDRLLASPAYGERMAQAWLDAARYADTSGYHFDSPRDMWLWRDWVIRAFNENMPFDQFTIEQLAGDMLPGASIDQKIASGFNRNVMTNDEGGADPEEYLTKYVVDRVNTTSAIWLGTTLGCAECHDHKYDRISIKEFYQFFAFFHNVPEKGLDGTRTANPHPKLAVPRPEQVREMARLDEAIAAAEAGLKALESELAAAQSQWEAEVKSGGDPPAEPGEWVARIALAGGLEAEVPGQPARAVQWQGGEATWGEGLFGQALQFSGQQHLDAGPLVTLEHNVPFSFGCWTRIAPPGGTLIARMDEAASHRGFDLLADGSGKLSVHLVHAWPDRAIKVTTREPAPLNEWIHVMVTYNGTGKARGVKLFVNGREKPHEVNNDNLSGTLVAEVPLHLGRRSAGVPFHGAIQEVRFYGRQLSPASVKELYQAGTFSLVRIPPGERTATQQTELARHFRQNHAASFLAAQKRLADLRKEKEQLVQKIPDVMVMEEMASPRETFILVRGNFQQKGEKVSANVPEFLPPLGPGMPANRLGLARWLVSPDHPLTSRVTVNRLWSLLFGTGLVKTVNDFGSQGEWPSHPELLDWLAAEFRDRGWDVKHLMKTMVMSATYRQSAAVTPERLQKDPYNRLLSRGPRHRLDAEFIRDNALAISGLLNRQIGGPSVKPYQPPGLWEVTDRKYDQSRGADLYRRGLYVYWKRAVHYPSFATFDAPNREICVLQRPRTSTPLQSLVLMNDPVYVEAARAFAQRILREGGPDLRSRSLFALRTALARHPRKGELDILENAFQEQLAHFQKTPEAADALTRVGESPRPEDLPLPELAAWTAVANVLLNLNETIYK